MELADTIVSTTSSFGWPSLNARVGHAPGSPAACSGSADVDLTALWMKSDTGDDVNVHMA